MRRNRGMHMALVSLRFIFVGIPDGLIIHNYPYSSFCTSPILPSFYNLPFIEKFLSVTILRLFPLTFSVECEVVASIISIHQIERLTNLLDSILLIRDRAGLVPKPILSP